MNDPEVLKYEDWEPHQSTDFTRGYISYITGGYKSDETYLWGIQLGEELIGHILGGSALAYYLRRDCWSKGYTTEAVRTVIKYMFTEVGIEKIEAKHSVKNIASGKVLQKAGMIFEKHEKAVYYCDSEWQDCDFYFLTKDDFMGCRRHPRISTNTEHHRCRTVKKRLRKKILYRNHSGRKAAAQYLQHRTRLAGGRRFSRI